MRSLWSAIPRPIRQALDNPASRGIFYSLTVRLEPVTLSLDSSSISLLMESKLASRVKNAAGMAGKLTGYDKNGSYEYALSHRLLEYLTPSTVLIDIGSGNGYYGLLAAKHCHPENVFCFEPQPLYHWILSKNNHHYCSGKLHLSTRFVGNAVNDKMTSLDSFCAQHKLAPHIIKMDIEGAEFYALDGMQRVLAEHHPKLFIECHERKMRNSLGVDPKIFLDKLERLGYAMSYNGHHWYTAQNEGEVDPGWHATPPNDINYALFCNPVEER
jgi:hypothetical protein